MREMGRPLKPIITTATYAPTDILFTFSVVAGHNYQAK